MPLSRANKYFNRIFNRGHSGPPTNLGKLFKLKVSSVKLPLLYYYTIFDAIVLVDIIIRRTIRK